MLPNIFALEMNHGLTSCDQGHVEIKWHELKED